MPRRIIDLSFVKYMKATNALYKRAGQRPVLASQTPQPQSGNEAGDRNEGVFQRWTWIAGEPPWVPANPNWWQGYHPNAPVSGTSCKDTRGVQTPHLASELARSLNFIRGLAGETCTLDESACTLNFYCGGGRNLRNEGTKSQ